MATLAPPFADALRGALRATDTAMRNWSGGGGGWVFAIYSRGDVYQGTVAIPPDGVPMRVHSERSTIPERRLLERVCRAYNRVAAQETA